MSILRDRKREMCAYGLNGFEVGDTFQAWPLHLTLLPWFKRANGRQLREYFSEIAAATPIIRVELGKKALFGARHDIPVRMIQSPDQRIIGLHKDIYGAVSRAGGAVESDLFIHDRYSPHLSVRRELPIAKTILINHFALIEDIGKGQRQVEEVFKLRGTPI